VSVVRHAHADATLAHDVLTIFKSQPGGSWTVRQIWSRLPPNTPLGAVNSAVKALHRDGKLTVRRPHGPDGRVRIYTLAAA
jgi:hypothetical protein